MDTVLLQSLINGILLGGVYAAYSAGFSLIFGVMGVVNLAHGELIMLGAFTSYWLFELLGIDPYLSLPLAFLFLFCFGYLIQRYIINRVIELPHIMSYILTFGIHLMVANVALKLWSHDFRSITTTYSGANAAFAGLNIPYSRLTTFLLALFIITILWLFLNRTETGRAIRATAMDKEIARLMGVKIKSIYAVTFGLGAGVTGLAGASISPFEIISPEMGLQYTIVAFCVVVLGGMGYMPGVLWGGITLGIAQSLAVTYLNAGISIAVTFLLLFMMLVIRPTGIVGKGMVS
ncbi:MAG: Branched-chain amino acid transporter permease [Thermodesulfobacteriota bacterium]|nr:Branched-chain amino acid transporter permease [Thermodesulfobacteriota bacterium]